MPIKKGKAIRGYKQGTPVLNRSLEVDEKNKNFAITRLQSLLYKELKDYANKEGQGNTGL